MGPNFYLIAKFVENLQNKILNKIFFLIQASSSTSSDFMYSRILGIANFNIMILYPHGSM